MQFDILGVYSTIKGAKIGTGTTKQEAVPKTYWLVLQLGEDSFQLQALSSNHLPTLVKFVVTREKFLSDYEPEPDFYRQNTLPALKNHLLDKFGEGIIKNPDASLDEGLQEFKKLGLLDKGGDEQGEYTKTLLTKIWTEDYVLDFEQRNQINRFGKNLRKLDKFEDALAYYQKAVEMNPNDDHLYFNIARVYCQQGDLLQAEWNLDKCLEINPDLEQAKLFKAYIEKRRGHESA